MKRDRFILLILTMPLLLLNCVLTNSCSHAFPMTDTRLKAAIIDQLGSLYPNELFLEEVKGELERSGFTVTHITGDQINVDLYHKLPSYGYKLIIFRVHSNVLRGDKPYTGSTFLFTSEPYSKSKYLSQQWADRICSASVDEDSPRYFSVSSDFIRGYSQGQYKQTVIIVMGCNSLYSTDMAEAFISRGALLYTGWTASVKLDFVDDFTMALVRNLCVKDVSFKEALYQTCGCKRSRPHL